MESIQTVCKVDKDESFDKIKKGIKNGILNDILQEYCLKRNQFDPKKPSPNQFVNKLQLRMKIYYRNLYSLSSSPSKY